MLVWLAQKKIIFQLFKPKTALKFAMKLQGMPIFQIIIGR